MLVKALDRPFQLGRRWIDPHNVFSVTYTVGKELEQTGLVVPIEVDKLKFDWYPEWRNQICVLIGSGPSAKNIPLKLARGKAKFIAINNSWKLAPWAHVLYASDFMWWEKEKGLTEFMGLKITQDCKSLNKPHWNLRLVTTIPSEDRILLTSPGVIGWGGNSGFGALNLAVQFGATRIVLVGYDMNIDKGLHWHGKHPVGLNNPSKETTKRWREVLDDQKPLLSALGVEMLNASPDSALTAYQKVDFREFFSSCPLSAESN